MGGCNCIDGGGDTAAGPYSSGGGVVTSSNGVLASWNAGRIAARATDPAYAAYDALRANKHMGWPLFGFPERLMAASAKAFFKVKDRL